MAACRTGVVARRYFRVHPELRHEPAAHVVPVKVATDAKLRELDFSGSKDFARAAYTVIGRVVEVVDVIGVHPKLTCKDFRVYRGFFGSGVSGQPGEVGKRKRLGWFLFFRALAQRGRQRWRFRGWHTLGFGWRDCVFTAPAARAGESLPLLRQAGSALLQVLDPRFRSSTPLRVGRRSLS